MVKTTDIILAAAASPEPVGCGIASFTGSHPA
jgi:hypothetical protein